MTSVSSSLGTHRGRNRAFRAPTEQVRSQQLLTKQTQRYAPRIYVRLLVASEEVDPASFPSVCELYRRADYESFHEASGSRRPRSLSSPVPSVPMQVWASKDRPKSGSKHAIVALVEGPSRSPKQSRHGIMGWHKLKLAMGSCCADCDHTAFAHWTVHRRRKWHPASRSDSTRRFGRVARTSRSRVARTGERDCAATSISAPADRCAISGGSVGSGILRCQSLGAASTEKARENPVWIG